MRKTLSFVDVYESIEDNEDFYMARLLILIYVFSKSNKPFIEGVTKLAILDFFLRYPTYLERLVTLRGRSISQIKLENYERNSVEATMVKYKYGPWDYRYRRFLLILLSKGLIKYTMLDGKVLISITDKGKKVVEAFYSQEVFRRLIMRANVIKTNCDRSASSLVSEIYKFFPEIANLDYNQRILV